MPFAIEFLLPKEALVVICYVFTFAVDAFEAVRAWFTLRGERGKRAFDCDKQVEKAVTAPNCMLKSSWGEGGSGGIRKKLKSEYTAYLESKYRRNDGSSI